MFTPSMYVRGRAIALFVLIAIFGLSLAAAGQPPFDKAEFAARRAKVFEKIGDSVALVFANEEHPHAVKYREAPDFYYLTGIEEPGAVLALNGKTKRTFVAAPKKPLWKLRSEGPGIRDIEDAADRYGITRVVAFEDFYTWFNSVTVGSKKIYVPLTPPDQLQYGRGEVVGLDAEAIKLPFGQLSRTKTFIAGLHSW